MADIPKPAKSNFDATKDTKSCPLCHVRTHAFWASRLWSHLGRIEASQQLTHDLHTLADAGARALPELLRLSHANADRCVDCAAAEGQRGVYHQHVKVKVLP